MDCYSVVPGAGLSALRRGASITPIRNPPSAVSAPPAAEARSASDVAQADILTDKVASLYYHCHHTLPSVCTDIDGRQRPTRPRGAQLGC